MSGWRDLVGLLAGRSSYLRGNGTMEIRFRVWNGNKMYYLDGTQPVDDQFLLGMDGSLYEKTSGSYEEEKVYKLPACYVAMLSTGLKDKDGKEIWEGDVLRKNSVFFTVDSIATMYAPYDYGSYLNTELDKLFVVGNIHENPELIKIPEVAAS
jgi:hypothetical protein